jgi:hypothetical protein
MTIPDQRRLPRIAGHWLALCGAWQPTGWRISAPLLSQAPPCGGVTWRVMYD